MVSPEYAINSSGTMSNARREILEREAFEAASRQDSDRSSTRILSQIEFMSDQLSKSFALLEVLSERIRPILMPEAPEPANIEVPKRTGLGAESQMSETLDSLNGRISFLQRTISDLTERVQL